MDTLWPWIKKHPFRATILSALIFFAPLLIVNFLFKTPAINSWFIPEWEASSVLEYIAGFEAFLGTLLLGIITVHQNSVSQKATEQLASENNALQKISIQRLLPSLKIAGVTVHRTEDDPHLIKDWEGLFCREPIAIVEAHEKDQIKFTVYVKLGNFSSTCKMHKKSIQLNLENISESVINQIVLEKIEFPEYKEKDKTYPKAILESTETVFTLLVPHECVQLTFEIYFSDDVYKTHWENSSHHLGYFCMNLTLKSSSMSGIENLESIYVGKQSDAKERTIYWESTH